MNLKHYIYDVPDFPEPGIVYKDITPLLGDPIAFKYAIDCMANYLSTRDIDAIVGIEARGFLFATPLAYILNKSLVPVRKEDKLPRKCYRAKYSLEYGNASMEIHIDAIKFGQRVFVVDDLLATGGTLAAAVGLVENLGCVVDGLGVAIELTDLKGRSRFPRLEIFSLVQF